MKGVAYQTVSFCEASGGSEKRVKLISSRSSKRNSCCIYTWARKIHSSRNLTQSKNKINFTARGWEEYNFEINIPRRVSFHITSDKRQQKIFFRGEWKKNLAGVIFLTILSFLEMFWEILVLSESVSAEKREGNDFWAQQMRLFKQQAALLFCVYNMLLLSESRERKPDIAAACLASTAAQTFDLSRCKNSFCIPIEQENHFRPTHFQIIHFYGIFERDSIIML